MPLNVLLTALGSDGDVHPFAGIGTCLRRRGHRVTIISNPRFEGLIRGLDIQFVPVGTAEQFDAILDNPDLWHPWKAFKTVAEFGILQTVRPIYEILRDHFIDGETVVGAHSLDLGARIAQEKLGVPTATIHLAPAVFRSEHLPPVLLPGLTFRWTPRSILRLLYWLADATIADPILAGPVNAFRRELGLPPVRRILHQWWYSPDRVIGLFPDWFGPQQPDWPGQTRLTGFPLWDTGKTVELSEEATEFLQAGPSPIVFTPGSAMLQGQKFFTAAVDACQQLGKRGLLLTRFAEQIPRDLPDSIRHFDYVPFSHLLPRSLALVHHGGIGTVSQGLAAGVPQLVMPMAHDQHDNAARLRRLGVAESIRPSAFHGPNVAATLNRLIMSADVASRCQGISVKLNGADAVNQACDLIERLVH